MVNKVLFDHTIFLHQKNGGVSKYIYELNKNLNQNNKNSIIFSPISINDNLNISKKNIISYFSLNRIPRFCTKIFYFLNDLLTLLYVLLKNPSVIHLTYYNTFLVKILNIPFVLTVYDLTHEKQKIYRNKFDKKYLISKAKKIICISKNTKKDLIKYYNVKEENIKVIYLGVKQKKVIKTKKKNTITFVGARDGYKNFKNFILAYSKSEFLKENYKVQSFGYKNFSIEEENLFKRLKIENKIKYISGDEKKLNEIYSNSSLLIYPSLYEGFGLPPLEAMRCGCPVASSNIKVLKEILGDASIFFNPKNIYDIKKKIEMVLKSRSLQKKKIKKGFQRIKMYKWSKCAKETLKVYKSFY